ncbi:uncharacterized protein HMPREF1541_10165 [Cyphellophora europaea CBS 101466]|uniref:SGT1 and CS domain-containing protein n=1 Tax=Cyphellophora europaea (strain CBS 101466) TaxID=1220924 RepID=W2S795_CYPE1|nr:uncharacterized protein HMPREF1541_10165 [Cyphellophora europaea CBS 101466]ETN44495.1 hypothetical protein HMPREF1541_10165 [Cyphellophora europaea CBS 101466]
MDNCKTGLALLDKGDASGALISFTKALIEHPTSPDYYIHRSKAFARLSPGRYDLALKDAEYAILFARQRGSRQKMQEGQLRRVVAFYNHGQYAAAQKLLTYSSKWDNAQMFKMWTAKVEQKLKTLPESEKVEIEVKEVPEVTLPTADQAKSRLKKQINADGSFNLSAAESDELVPDEPQADKQAAVASSTTHNTTSAPVVIRQDWFQTGTTVTVTLFAKGVDKEKFNADIQEGSLYISFPNPGNPDSEYSFSVDPFYARVDVSQSKVNVFKTKIEIILTKSTPNQKWGTLEGKEPLTTSNGSSGAGVNSIQQSVPKKESGPVYPTSSKTGAKNWDKLAADLTAKPKKDQKSKADEDGSASEGEDDPGYDSDEGGDAVDGFFKKLYAGSDEDTRRAMMKSYYESGGTSLSTNWDEVGQKRVEPYQSKDD